MVGMRNLRAHWVNQVGPRLWAICLAVALAGLVLSPVTAQDTNPPDPAVAVDPNFLAPVIIDGEVLFEIRGSSALPAPDRARIVQERIIAIAEQSDLLSIDFTIRGGVFGKEVIFDGQRVTITTASDAQNDQMGIDVLAHLQAEAIQRAIIAYREARSGEARVQSAQAAVA